MPFVYGEIRLLNGLLIFRRDNELRFVDEDAQNMDRFSEVVALARAQQRVIVCVSRRE